jgi:hypothetical protein
VFLGIETTVWDTKSKLQGLEIFTVKDEQRRDQRADRVQQQQDQ